MKNKMIFDVVMLVVYVFAANPVLTGLTLHEYVGLGAFVVIIAHTAMNGNALSGRKNIGMLILNALLILTLCICVVSGIMVSGAILPALGLYADGYYFWDPLHAISAKLFLACVLIHVALRAPMVVGFFKKTLRKSAK